MHLLDAIRSWPLRRELRGHLRAFVESSPQPVGRAPVHVDGPRSLHVLLLGSGLAVGYGSTDRRYALDGHLARRLARSTRRGVVVSNFASPSSSLLEQVLEGQMRRNLDDYDVVVWTPSSLDMCTRILPESWRSQLARLARLTERTSSMVVPALPVARTDDAAATPAVEFALRLNDDLRRAVREHPNVTVVTGPAVPLVAYGHPDINERYLSELANSIADAALDGLRQDELAAAGSMALPAS